MELKLRLQRGAYVSDIIELRSKIRANGTLPKLGIINVSHPGIKNTIKLHINLAYQPNPNLGSISGSLYTIAFENGNGIWNFNVKDIADDVIKAINDRAEVVHLPNKAIPGALAGNYASLGYPSHSVLPKITDDNLKSAILEVDAYTGNGGKETENVLKAITRLIIAVNEATRFDSVAIEIDSILGLGGEESYNPSIELFQNWGGHFLEGGEIKNIK
jgi:Ribosome inactivating protein